MTDNYLLLHWSLTDTQKGYNIFSEWDLMTWQLFLNGNFITKSGRWEPYYSGSLLEEESHFELGNIELWGFNWSGNNLEGRLIYTFSSGKTNVFRNLVLSTKSLLYICILASTITFWVVACRKNWIQYCALCLLVQTGSMLWTEWSGNGNWKKLR